MPTKRKKQNVEKKHISEILLSIKNVSKSFGGIKALNKCTLEIQKGSITALIGPNGSGKSTLFHCISNLIKPESGSIKLHNQELTTMQDYAIARLGIARTFQQVRLFRYLSIKDHIAIAQAKQDESLLHSFFNSKPDHIKKIKRALDLVGLNKPLNTKATDLSYGQRKLLDIAIAIAKPHQLLMLDEPVAGVNPKLRTTIKNVIKKVNKNGDTILLVEHDMNFVMDIAEHIYVLDAGSVIAQGTPQEIRNNKKVLEAYLGD